MRRVKQGLGPFIAITLWGTLAWGQGASLVDGLGGPHDIGQAFLGGELAVDEAFPDGLDLYDAAAATEVWVNNPAVLSLGSTRCCYQGDPLPDPTPRGLAESAIVALEVQHWPVIDRPLDDPAWHIFTHIRPDAGPAEPGRLTVTWYEMTDVAPDDPRSRYVTTQMVMTNVGQGDFDIEVRYHQCEWSAPPRRPTDFAVVGFDALEGADGPGWMWAGSLTADTEKLCQLSNVREVGIFRYRVRDGIPRGCGPDADPPPGPDRCADGNHLPGDGCSPACYIEPDVDGDGIFEAPHPDSVDPDGVYDDCFDPVEMQCIAVDADGDGVPDALDNCPEAGEENRNPDQHDYDDDGVGDACDRDSDRDFLDSPPIEGEPDSYPDNCPLVYNRGVRAVDRGRPATAQPFDTDRDGLGDACDDDDDDDGVLDCGLDGICDPLDNAYDEDRDLFVDEAGECDRDAPNFFEDCARGDRDFFDNDGDGFVDEFTEAGFPRMAYPGPDEGEDNCRRIPNPGQADQDGDGIGDACDGDVDGDGIPDCDSPDGICGPEADHRDNDGDGTIDEDGECVEACRFDQDGDLIDQDLDGFVDEGDEPATFDVAPARLDVCPDIPDPEQIDGNGNGDGDLCDDNDRDGFIGLYDNCPDLPNDQVDTDGDGLGDDCDDDLDGDDVDNTVDNCLDVPNDTQVDTDGDREGDACDLDDDGDGINDGVDNCPLVRNPDGIDTDGDGMGDVCDDDDDGDGIDDAVDVCPRVADPDLVDLDEDGEGDACDPDDDGDRVEDDDDNCPRLINPSQGDADDDGVGDACDPDDDGDGVPDGEDICPSVADPDQSDLDGDGQGDACDEDDDGDRVDDGDDLCPRVPDPQQSDLDGDRLGDACDPDDDDDGIADDRDVCPTTADDQKDTDGDGMGDACDEDDDGDGIPDTDDICPATADAAQDDLDGDGIGDACDATDDRPFADLSAEEKCAALIERRAPTLERLRYCPPAVDGDGCSIGVGVGSRAPPPWVWCLAFLGLRRRRP